LILNFYHSEGIKDVIIKDSENEKLFKEYHNCIKNEELNQNEKFKSTPKSQRPKSTPKFSNQFQNQYSNANTSKNPQNTLVKPENILYVKKY
jgi:hypothetical protein